MTTGGIFRMKKGKRYAEAAKLVDRTKLYDVQEAVSVVKKAANALNGFLYSHHHLRGKPVPYLVICEIGYYK